MIVNSRLGGTAHSYSYWHSPHDLPTISLSKLFKYLVAWALKINFSFENDIPTNPLIIFDNIHDLDHNYLLPIALLRSIPIHPTWSSSSPSPSFLLLPVHLVKFVFFSTAVSYGSFPDVAGLPGFIPLKETHFLSPSHYQSPKAPQFFIRLLAYLPAPFWDFVWMWLALVLCIMSQSLWIHTQNFLVVSEKGCGKTHLNHIAPMVPTSDSYNHSMLSSMNLSWHLVERHDVDVPFGTECSLVSFLSAHGSPVTIYNKKFF